MSAYDYFSLGHPLARMRSRYALAARKKMFDSFMAWARPTSQARVLDLGVTPDTTLEESNFFERWYPFPRQLTAASIEDVACLVPVFPEVNIIQLHQKILPFADDEFDVLFCSAVLEHVGSRDDQREFIREAARVSRRFFLTTPNRWFPMEFHTLLPLIHWLPQRIHQAILRALGHEFLSKTENLNLLGETDIREIVEGVATITIERIGLFGFTSNLVVYGERN